MAAACLRVFSFLQVIDQCIRHVSGLSPLPFFYHQMIALKKLWKMYLIYGKSFFCSQNIQVLRFQSDMSLDNGLINRFFCLDFFFKKKKGFAMLSKK